MEMQSQFKIGNGNAESVQIIFTFYDSNGVIFIIDEQCQSGCVNLRK
jgi:hypothetical protein